MRVIKLRGGILLIEESAFDECILLNHIDIFTNALVVTQTEGNHSFHFSTDGTIPPTGHEQVVITSECFYSMRSAEIVAAESDITQIMGMQISRNDKRGRLREWLALHEMRHREDITTILELGLWKVTMSTSSSAIREIRDDSRARYGAGVIIPHVLPFL